MSKRLVEMEISAQGKAIRTLAEMKANEQLKELGVESFQILETRRTLAVQMAYYSRSRMSVEDVKKMYRAVGMYEISDTEAKTANTWTLESKHIQGKAIDIVPIKNNKPWWNAPLAVWEIMGAIGERNNLKWGGRWKNKDCPHFEE